MSLSPGTSLGHYDVTAKLGEGGMGEVWQATDTQLNRQVALKILPDAFADDPDRLARFQREAKVLASLNHPGIASIYGIEKSDDTQALVLELVEGPTLADRIAKGPIPVDEALPIAKQIAEALEAAHEAGVIHRDLKPANIKVRADGTVKVLDFGLAKALDRAPEGDPSQSPTLTAAATQMGVIMGTAAYMSPEQARGKSVDKRADIWSFGVVLLEMLTGRKVFEAEDVSTTLSSVLQREPDWSHLPSAVSPSLSVFLHRCLNKDPRQRVADMQDVRLAMEGAFETTEGVPSKPDTARAVERSVVVAMAVLAALVLGGVAVWLVTRPSPPRPVRFSVSPDSGGSLHVAVASPDIAISPNGEHIAYLSGVVGFGAERLHVRPLDQFASETLVAEGELVSPFFSPDGESVGFYDRRGGDAPVLQRVSAQGGLVSTICELAGDLRGASWGADGTIVFAAGNVSGLWRVPAVGGEPEQLTTPNPGGAHLWPEILPGGEKVLFTIVANPIEESQIAVLSLDTGDHEVILRGGSFPRYASTGHLIYGVGGSLWAVRFDLGRAETVGDPVPVLEGALTKSGGSTSFSVSKNGSLIYVPDVRQASAGRGLVWIDRQGTEEQLGAPPAAYISPRISPDGRYVTVAVTSPDNTDVMAYDLQRGTLTRLTSDPATDSYPLWTPDGRRVLFSSDRGGSFDIYSRAADGTGEAEPLARSDADLVAQSWSSDGRTLVVEERLGDDTNIGVFSIGGESSVEKLVDTAFYEGKPTISPDGRWIAYESDLSGRREVVVQPFPNVADGRWQVSRDGGFAPVWGPGGQELFFRGGASFGMMVVAVETEPAFAATNLQDLWQNAIPASEISLYSPSRNWDLADDGRALFVDTRPTVGMALFNEVNVILNWFEELKVRVPPD